MAQLSLRHLRWLALAAVLLSVVLTEVVRTLLEPYLDRWTGRLIMDGAVLLLGLSLLGALFHILERSYNRIERQHRETAALHAAALDIWDALTLETTLQRVVDQARQLIDCRYGALSVIDENGRIESFITSGISGEERERIGPPPQGKGILALPLHDGQRLRLADLGRDPRAVGFPPGHPSMRSLVAVPILCKSPFRGNLYLAEKNGADEFSDDDEASLARFATTAAIAIDNAYLHRRLQGLAVSEERLRIAHEMHDGLAQVLAYVNTKAQAVREFLKTGRAEEASRQLEQLASAAREVYADLRESIMGLRTGVGPGRTMVEALTEFVAAWRGQTGIGCNLAIDEGLRLSPAVELQLLRIVQEALANVRKHAHASKTEVQLARRADRVVILIVDDGVGFNPAEIGRSGYPRFGLTTMRERAESIGGEVRWDSASPAGTRVTIEIPLQTPTQLLDGSAA